MNQWQTRFVGLATIFGGSLGLLQAILPLFQQSDIFARLFCIGFALLYGWGCWAGLLLVERREQAFNHVHLYWALQIPVFMTPYFGFSFGSGAFANLWFNFSTFAFGFKGNIGSTFSFSIAQSFQPYIYGVNVVAILMVHYLSKFDPFQNTTVEAT